MAREIAGSLSEIDARVKVLNKSLRDGQTEGRGLDKALRLDSKDTQLVECKMRNLQNSGLMGRLKIMGLISPL